MIGFVEEAAKIVAEKVKLPPGYYLMWSGQFENQVRAKKKLSVLVPLSLLINFLILYLAFRNVTQTAIIFLAIPVPPVILDTQIGNLYGFPRKYPSTDCPGLGCVVRAGS